MLLIIAALVLLGSGYKLAMLKTGGMEKQDVFLAGETPEMHSGDAPAEGEKKVQEIIVHVIGAVEKPGVYKLPAGARVVDAVNMAVPAANARLDLLNLAAPLPDGHQVVVFSEQDYQESLLAGTNNTGAVSAARVPPGGVSPAGLPSVAGPGGAGLININTAGQAELETLPGIGPALAQRIIEYRNSNGQFLSPADIKNVSGIGDKKFEQIKDKITVS